MSETVNSAYALKEMAGWSLKTRAACLKWDVSSLPDWCRSHLCDCQRPAETISGVDEFVTSIHSLMCTQHPPHFNSFLTIYCAVREKLNLAPSANECGVKWRHGGTIHVIL